MATNDDPTKKVDDPAKKADDGATDKAADKDGGGDTGGSYIAALMKDPEGVRALLAEKRAARAEAKELRLRLEAADQAQKDREAADLKEQNKFKELSEKREGELKAEKDLHKNSRSAFEKRLIDMHLKIEAQAAGALDDDAVVALASRADIKVGDNYEAQGVKETVEALKKSKPHLFGSKDPKVAPPAGGLPSPRAGFTTDVDVSKASARSLIEKGLEKK